MLNSILSSVPTFLLPLKTGDDLSPFVWSPVYIRLSQSRGRVSLRSLPPCSPLPRCGLALCNHGQGVGAADGSVLVATPLVTLSGWWVPCCPRGGASCF